MQDMCGGLAPKKESARRQSLHFGQKHQLSDTTRMSTLKIAVIQSCLFFFTLFAYTGYGTVGWTEFTDTFAVGDFTSVDQTWYTNTSWPKSGGGKVLLEGAVWPDGEVPNNLNKVMEGHRKWFVNATDWLKVENGKRHVGREIFFRVLPAYSKVQITEVYLDVATGTKHREKHAHAHKWEPTSTFDIKSEWDSSTSCYSPFAEKAKDSDTYKNNGPGEMGDIMQFYGQQWAPVMKLDSATDTYYVSHIKYEDAKCAYLFWSYFFGGGAISFSCFAAVSCLVFVLFVVCHDPDAPLRGKPVLIGRATFMAKCKLCCQTTWHFLRKRGPQLVGFACAASCGCQGVFALLACSQMASFHGHWYYFMSPFYFMGVVGFADFYAFARMSSVIHDFYVKGKRLMLQNVPEGLWARKVECGGVDGFKNEKRLGMHLAKVGKEIVVTQVRGFSKTKGSLTEQEEETGVSEYFANNVQVGDVFLGIMTVPTLTVREAKTKIELEADAAVLEAWDPDRLEFKAGTDYEGFTLSNEEYVMLQKPWKWRNLETHKVYEFMTPHVDPRVEDAERLLAKAKAEANPKEEGIVGKPYWILTWRVNNEGVKKAQFPVPTACTKEEYKKLEYASETIHIQHETLDEYTTSLGLDLEDLALTRTVESHIETQGVVVLASSNLSKSVGLKPDDVIVGLNYTPLTKSITSTKLMGLIKRMPMPFVLNVSCKTRDWHPLSQDSERAKQKARDELKRFNKLLLLLVLLFAGFALSVTATSSTEWTVCCKGAATQAQLADYGIGIWFASVSKQMAHTQEDRFSMAMSRLVWCDETGLNQNHLDATGGECFTKNGEMYDYKIATRVSTCIAVFFGLIGCFSVTLLLLLGVDSVTAKVSSRYVLVASISSLVQSIFSIIGASCWGSVHDAIIGRKDNCLVQYLREGQMDETGFMWPNDSNHTVTLSWLDPYANPDWHTNGGSSRGNFKALTDDYAYGRPVCLEDFTIGPAWLALIVASAFTFLLSIDSILSFAVYGHNQTVDEKMAELKKNKADKLKQRKFENMGEKAVAANHIGGHGVLGAAGDAFGNIKGVAELGAGMTAVTGGMTELTGGMTKGLESTRKGMLGGLNSVKNISFRHDET